MNFKLNKTFAIILAILFLLISSNLYAAGAILSNYETFYKNYDPSNTAYYVYDAADGSGDESGKYYCYNYTYKTIQISIPTLASTSIAVRIEGRVDSTTDLVSWANIYSKTYTSPTTIDDSIMVTEHMEYIRIGLLVTGDSTDDVSIRGNFGIPKALL